MHNNDSWKHGEHDNEKLSEDGENLPGFPDPFETEGGEKPLDQESAVDNLDDLI